MGLLCPENLNPSLWLQPLDDLGASPVSIARLVHCAPVTLGSFLLLQGLPHLRAFGLATPSARGSLPFDRCRTGFLSFRFQLSSSEISSLGSISH